MISFLKGYLRYKKPPFIVVDVNGLGYECQAPLSTFCHLPDLGQQVFLYTHFVVREDAQVLYGFFREDERSLFRLLIKVSSVGPKLGLAILSGIEPEHFVRSIKGQDINTLTHIPGVGKKTAERLIIELRDKLANLYADETLEVSTPALREDRLQDDALSALVALGFKSQEAARLVSKVENPCSSVEELIRLALQSSVPRGSKNDKLGSPDKCSIAD